MAVSPFRALATAHLQSSWNRLRKKSGVAALWAFLLVVALVFGAIAVPILSGLALLGWAAGSALRHPEAAQAVVFGSLGLTGLTFAAGFVGGVTSGSRQLPWETLRGFPVRTFTLFAAECFAGGAEVITLVELAALLVTCGGAAVASPAAAPFFALLFLTHAVMLLALQQLFGSLVQRATRQLRAVLLVLPLIAVGTSTFLPVLARRLSGDRAQLVTDKFTALAPLVPARWTLEAARRWLEGSTDLPTLALGVALPVLLAVVVVVLAWQFVAREKPLTFDVDRTTPARLWTFQSQAVGVARLQFESLARSLPGRFGLVMPLLTLFLIRGPLAELLPGNGWTAPIAFGYASLAGANLLFNQFGLDRHGVKVLFLLPVEPLAILRGKWLGFAAWQALQAALLLGLLILTGKGSALEYALGLVLSTAVFLVLAMVGQFVSIWQPRPLRTNGLRAAQPPVVVVVVMFGTLLSAGAVLYGTLYGVRIFAPGWELPALAGLTALLGALSLPVSHANAHFLARNRETLVETLGAAG